MPNLNDFSEPKLNFAYWYVNNKVLLRKIVIVVLLVVNTATLFFVSYSLILALGIKGPSYQAFLNTLAAGSADYQNLRQQDLPKPLQLGLIQALPNADTFDVLLDVNNPNLKWWATFDYQFRIGETLSEPRSSFIFPGETKKLTDLALENGDQASELVLSNINWTKDINFPAKYQERFRFDVQNVSFIPSSELGVGESVPISRLSFDVTNETAYNYRNVNFSVLLYFGDQIIAVNQLVSSAFYSGETKTLEINFFQKLPKITSSEVLPEINILDSNNYLQL